MFPLQREVVLSLYMSVEGILYPVRVDNPLNPKSDQHLISSYNITPESRIKVMRKN